VSQQERGKGDDRKAVPRTSVERQAEQRRAAHRRTRRIIRAGQVLMALGALIAVQHMVGHLGGFGGTPSALTDVLVGYPTAAVVFLLGAVMAGR